MQSGKGPRKRHPLEEIKRCLDASLGRYREDYWIILKKYLCAEISRWEMMVAMNLILPQHSRKLHNKLIKAILHNAVYGASPPSKRKRQDTPQSVAERVQERGARRARRQGRDSGAGEDKGVVFTPEGRIHHNNDCIPSYDPLKHIGMENLHTLTKYFSRFSQYPDVDQRLLHGPYDAQETDVTYACCVTRQLPSFHEIRGRLLEAAVRQGLNNVSDEAVGFVQKALEHKIKCIITKCFDAVQRKRKICKAVRRTAFIATPPAALGPSFTDAMRKVAIYPKPPKPPVSSPLFPAKRPPSLTPLPSLPITSLPSPTTPFSPFPLSPGVPLTPTPKTPMGLKSPGGNSVPDGGIGDPALPNGSSPAVNAKKRRRVSRSGGKKKKGGREEEPGFVDQARGVRDGSTMSGEKQRLVDKTHEALVAKSHFYAPRKAKVHFEILEDALNPDFQPELEGSLPPRPSIQVEDLGEVLSIEDPALLGPSSALLLEKVRAAHLRT